MEDLISRSALLEKATGVVKYDEGGWDCNVRAVFVDDVLNAPAVDPEEVFKSLPYIKEALEMAKQTVAPVIRCKDCYYWMKAKVTRSGNLVCPKSGMEITATDFCSKADKRRCKYDR